MTTSHASCWNSSFRRANCLWAHDSASASPSHYPGQGSCNPSCSFLATLLYVDHLIIQGRAHATAAAASLQFCSMLTVSLSRAGLMQPWLQLLCNPAPCLLFSEITASAPVLQLCGSGPHSCRRAHSRRRQATPEHREGGGSTGNLPPNLPLSYPLRADGSASAVCFTPCIRHRPTVTTARRRTTPC